MAAKTPSESAPKKDDVAELIDRAQRGDRAALPMLRASFEQPHFVEATGNLARMAEGTLVAKYSSTNLLVKEGLTRKLDSLRAELAGPVPTPLERLLAERITLCWLHLHHLESVYAEKGSMSLDLAGYYQRAITSAHKRYLSAIKALAAVRKLALPVLQVNIARKQVNVAGPAVVGDSPKETA